MDAATRAELDALRLRAYGPSADIAEDGAALERLVQLEELALPARPDSPEPRPDERSAASGVEPSPAPTSGTQLGSAPGAARVVEVLPARARGPRSRRGWHLALVAAVALAAVPLAVTAASRTVADAVPSRAAGQIPASVRDALAFATDPRSQTLIQVRIDGSFGDYVDIAPTDDIPPFPVEGLMTWVEPLGDYYGWEVWIGGARGAIEDENCLVLDGDGTTRAGCASTALKAQGALLLSVPYAEVLAEERPEAMTPDQSLGFWWSPDGVITILLGPTPVDGASRIR